jgi:hypothetical protein
MYRSTSTHYQPRPLPPALAGQQTSPDRQAPAGWANGIRRCGTTATRRTPAGAGEDKITCSTCPASSLGSEVSKTNCWSPCTQMVYATRRLRVMTFSALSGRRSPRFDNCDRANRSANNHCTTETSPIGVMSWRPVQTNRPIRPSVEPPFGNRRIPIRPRSTRRWPGASVLASAAGPGVLAVRRIKWAQYGANGRDWRVVGKRPFFSRFGFPVWEPVPRDFPRKTAIRCERLQTVRVGGKMMFRRCFLGFSAT